MLVLSKPHISNRSIGVERTTLFSSNLCRGGLVQKRESSNISHLETSFLTCHFACEKSFFITPLVTFSQAGFFSLFRQKTTTTNQSFTGGIV